MIDRHARRRPKLWHIVVIALPLLLLALAVLAVAPLIRANAADGSTIDFTHQKHIAAGVECLFCHPQALNGPVATIPSEQRCVGCHQNIQVGTASGQDTIDQLMTLWQEQQPLRWPKLVDLPDFVNFNHRPHIAAGKHCETCHGDVGSMELARPTDRINMGFCLNNCHRHEDPEKRVRLMDCATCHR